jgi:tetratricopeptide (TPR) repeat protein
MKNTIRTIVACNVLIGSLSLLACSQKKSEVYPKQPQEDKLTSIGTINGNDPLSVDAFQKLVSQLSVARIADEDKVIADHYNKFGISEDLKGQYELAMSYHTKALDIHKQLGNKVDLAKSYNNIAVVYRMMGKFSEATSHYLLAISSAEDTVCKAHALRNYGLLLQDQKKYTEAKTQYQAALDRWKTINDSARIEILLQDLEMINHLIGSANGRLSTGRPGQGGVERLY